MPADLHVDDRVTIPGRDLSWDAVRASGPGGQNVNKVATKVDLRFDLQGTEVLTDEQKARLRSLPGVRLDAFGRVVVVSQRTRNRVRNLADARDKLATLVAQALPEPKARRRRKPSKAAAKRRMEDKRRRAETKRGRARPEY